MTAASNYALALEALASRQRRSENPITRAHAEVNDALAQLVRAGVPVPVLGLDAPAPPPAVAVGEYRPPSIADGTVAVGLVDGLQHMVDEYGFRGVTETLREIGMTPLPPGGWTCSTSAEPKVLDVTCPRCKTPGKVLLAVYPKVRDGELSCDVADVTATPHECPEVLPK